MKERIKKLTRLTIDWDEKRHHEAHDGDSSPSKAFSDKLNRKIFDSCVSTVISSEQVFNEDLCLTSGRNTIGPETVIFQRNF